MRILVVHNYYKQAGGEDQCVAAEIDLLNAHGHDVSTYTVHNDAIDGLSHLQAAARTIWSRSSYHELRRLIRNRRPALVHFHNTFPLISPAAYFAARAENVGVVQTLHNFRLLCPNALFFRQGRVCEDCLGRSIPWPGVVHKCYRDSRAASAAVATMLTVHRALGSWREAVDAYIALTQFSRNKFIDGGLPPTKIHVKPNFVFPDPGAGAGTGNYALFVGRLSPEKGIEVLLDAWKTLGERMPLKIIGTGPRADAVGAAAANNSGIEWLGSKSLADVYALAAEALCLVLPSQCYENFPRVVIEAFAKGTPVVASRLGAMAEVVEHGRTGFHFNPGDASDLAAQVRQVEALRAMRQEARQEYERKYTATLNHSILMDIYERVVDGVRAPAQAKYAEVPGR